MTMNLLLVLDFFLCSGKPFLTLNSNDDNSTVEQSETDAASMLGEELKDNQVNDRPGDESVKSRSNAYPEESEEMKGNTPYPNEKFDITSFTNVKFIF